MMLAMTKPARMSPRSPELLLLVRRVCVPQTRHSGTPILTQRSLDASTRPNRLTVPIREPSANRDAQRRRMASGDHTRMEIEAPPPVGGGRAIRGRNRPDTRSDAIVPADKDPADAEGEHEEEKCDQSKECRRGPLAGRLQSAGWYPTCRRRTNTRMPTARACSVPTGGARTESGDRDVTAAVPLGTRRGVIVLPLRHPRRARSRRPHPVSADVGGGMTACRGADPRPDRGAEVTPVSADRSPPGDGVLR
jgi:hypothetical protein